MMMVLVIITLLLLAWIAFALYKLESVIWEMRRNDTYPDSAHPAFSRAAIRAERLRLDACGEKVEQLQRELNQDAEFAELCKIRSAPSPTIESKMKDACTELAVWYGYLRNAQFMIEANLMVQRGELTIAEARGLYDDINIAGGWARWSRWSDPFLNEWKENLASTEAKKTILARAEAKLTDSALQRRNHLAVLRTEWESKFEYSKPGPPRPRW
jgi:hypothetical protein